MEESDALEKSVEAMEFRRMFSHPMDANNCFINFQSGSGGTEAQDWANMLLRMYIRYGERKGFKVEVLDISDGDIAGIKSATLKISGDYAFGHLRTELGSIGWFENRHLTQVIDVIHHLRVCKFILRWMIRLKWILIQRI